MIKRILGKFIKAIAVIVLIPGILVWIAGITAFFFRLFIWYKTGQWNRFTVIEFIPNRFIAELTANYPRMQKEFYWILNKEIIIFFFGFGLILIGSFLIMNFVAKRCKEKPHIVADRLKNLIRNK
jgi:hypothetical protein